MNHKYRVAYYLYNMREAVIPGSHTDDIETALSFASDYAAGATHEALRYGGGWGTPYFVVNEVSDRLAMYFCGEYWLLQDNWTILPKGHEHAERE
jgi:hypothetical protein